LPSSLFYAFDHYQPNLKILREKGFNASQLNIEVDDFPFQSESVDLIIANQILEHCKEIFWIFHEVSRTLKVVGYFFVGLANLASFHSRILLLLGLQPTSIRTASAHVRGFTKADFINFLNSCARNLYSIEMFKGSNFYPFIAKTIANVFPNSAFSICFAIKKTKAYESEFTKYPLANQLETNFWVGKSSFN
jgi:hypothetical protein